VLLSSVASWWTNYGTYRHKKAQLKARLNRPKVLNTKGSHMVGLVRFELTTKGL
jgi:hypothetical protein